MNIANEQKNLHPKSCGASWSQPREPPCRRQGQNHGCQLVVISPSPLKEPDTKFCRKKPAVVRFKFSLHLLLKRLWSLWTATYVAITKMNVGVRQWTSAWPSKCQECQSRSSYFSNTEITNTAEILSWYFFLISDAQNLLLRKQNSM